ncbi:MAG: hypothetical protein ACRD1D_00470 [Acidimicrobiales bacterium]
MRLRPNRHNQKRLEPARVRYRPAEAERRSDLVCPTTSITASLAVALALVLLVAARRLGPLVVPAALMGAGFAIAHRRHQSRRTRVERLAVWALHAPGGPTDTGMLERLVAADLATMSDARPGTEILARAVVRSTVRDRWQLELAVERLGPRGHGLPDRLSSVRSGRRRRVPVLWGIPAATFVVLLTAPLVGPLSTVGAVVGTAIVVVTWAGLCHDWGYVPHQLVWTALLPPSQAPSLLPEPLLLELLAELAGGEVSLVDEATALVEAARPCVATDLALARMEAVRRAL